MTSTNIIAETVYKIARDGFEHEFGQPEVDITEHPAWNKILNAGTRIWLDTGDIDEAKKLWCLQFKALTTNNTLLNKEVQKGIYDDLIVKTGFEIRKAAPKIDENELLLEVAFVLNAYHGLRLVKLFDAHVSVELHTDLDKDVDRSVEYGKRYHQICPERFYIKVPFSSVGLLAARRLSKFGIPVNFTLGFSARQNYVAALFSQPAFINVFLGRLNSFVSDNNLGDGLNVGEKATIATQKELTKLRKDKKTSTLLIAASMRNAQQIVTLAGVDVHTIPPKVAAEFIEKPAEKISGQLQEDLRINLVSGTSYDNSNMLSLWDIPDTFKVSVNQLLKSDTDQLSPKDIQAYFAEAGFEDFLPKWTEQDIQVVTADGKIPVYDKWKAKLKNAEIGLDALMNVSAFYSFAMDQKKLDERIKSLLG